MSSGSATRQRALQMKARCTAEELAEVQAAATAAGFESVGEFIRSRCLQKVRAPKLPKIDRVELARALALLGKVGSNLNQLAHQANLGQPVERSEFVEVADVVRAASAAIMKTLGYGV